MIVIKQLNFDFVVDYISVVESSREGGFSLQPLQQFVRPQWEERCDNLNSVLVRNGCSAYLSILCGGSNPNAKAVRCALLGEWFSLFLALFIKFRTVYFFSNCNMLICIHYYSQIFIMWLDFVTYLHHHGHEEKLPWYRGKVLIVIVLLNFRGNRSILRRIV